MYNVGQVYIWQNQVGAYAVLNGQETTVTAYIGWLPHPSGFGFPVEVWLTDTHCPDPACCSVHGVVAWRGDLRPKHPPPGEAKVMRWFKIDHREPQVV